MTKKEIHGKNERKSNVQTNEYSYKETKKEQMAWKKERKKERKTDNSNKLYKTYAQIRLYFYSINPRNQNIDTSLHWKTDW